MSSPMMNGMVGRSSPGNSNHGKPSFEMVNSQSSDKSSSDLSYVNPVGLGQISLTDITLDQALERIQRLMEENKELRDYLKKNNDMMREQYQTLSQWKDKMRESNVENKNKFEETRKVILKLRKDNEGLMLKCEEGESRHVDECNKLTNKIKELEVMVVTLKNDKGASSHSNVMEHVHGAQITDLANQLRITREREVRVKDENEQLKRTVVEIRADSSKNTKETESLSQRLQAFQQESFALKNENKMLHSEVSGLQQKNHELALTHQTGAHLMGSPHSGSSEDKWDFGGRETLHAQISQKDRQIEVLNNEVYQLREQQSPSVTDIQTLRSQNMTLMGEIRETNEKLAASHRTVGDLEFRLKRTHENRHSDGTAVQSLQLQVNNLEAALNAERKELQTTKRREVEARQTLNNVMGEYKNMLSKQDQKDPAEKQRYLNEISHMTARMLAAEEAINYRDQQLKKMREENDKLKDEVQTIPVHIAQEELWKSDFEAERSAREQQQSEIETHKQEIKNLNLQNQQLREEFESYFQGQVQEMQKKHGSPGYGQGAPYQRQMQNQLTVVPPSPRSQAGPPSPHFPQPHIYVNEEHSPNRPPSQHQPHIQKPMVYPYQNVQNSHEQMSYPHSQAGRHDARGVDDVTEYQPMCCPKCNIQCPDVDTLQIHVLDCIDQG